MHDVPVPRVDVRPDWSANEGSALGRDGALRRFRKRFAGNRRAGLRTLRMVRVSSFFRRQRASRRRVAGRRRRVPETLRFDSGERPGRKRLAVRDQARVPSKLQLEGFRGQLPGRGVPRPGGAPGAGGGRRHANVRDARRGEHRDADGCRGGCGKRSERSRSDEKNVRREESPKPKPPFGRRCVRDVRVRLPELHGEPVRAVDGHEPRDPDERDDVHGDVRVLSRARLRERRRVRRRVPRR
mmetsp:Transcript_7989/g.33996  ORF Transcript_7989/g.33996 Transcript_7989/m.33996 type:complete len:241 (+) Transcript_7989:2306-3028(+)